MSKNLDLVQVLLDHHRDLIKPSTTQDVDVIYLAEHYGVAETEIVKAMIIALDEIELDQKDEQASKHCTLCGTLLIIHDVDGCEEHVTQPTDRRIAK